MQRGLKVILLVATALAGCASARGFHEAIEAARADVAEIHRSSGAPGMTAAVVADGRIVWTEGFGKADVKGSAMPADAELRIGSLTKLFTATTLAILADRGAVSLDDPAARYVPTFVDPHVTLRQLAHHLGGVRHYGRSDYINTTHYPSVTAAAEAFVHDPLVNVPGTKYYYSSFGYNLIGAALERATKTDFDALVRREVLEPFGMSHTMLDASVKKTPPGPIEFFERDRDSKIVGATAIDLSDRVPSGGYVSTASDLARFAIATLALPARIQGTLFESGRTADGTPTHVGLGWRLAQDEAGRAYVHHGGESVGGRAFLLVYPKERVAVVLMSNMSFAAFGEKEARRVAAHFLSGR